MIGAIPDEAEFGHLAIGPFFRDAKEINEIKRSGDGRDDDSLLEFSDELVEDEGRMTRRLDPVMHGGGEPPERSDG